MSRSKVCLARSITPQLEGGGIKTPPYTRTQWGGVTEQSYCDKLHAVRGTMLFEGGLNCKAAQANGSLLTWKAARKQNTPRFTAAATARLSPASSAFGAEQISLRGLCANKHSAHLHVSPRVQQNNNMYWRVSLTAVPCGPGGPGIPAWPGAPWRRENKRKLNIATVLFVRFSRTKMERLLMPD